MMMRYMMFSTLCLVLLFCVFSANASNAIPAPVTRNPPVACATVCGNDAKRNLVDYNGQANTYTPPAAELRASIFDGLTADELSSVAAWMINNTALNLTEAANAKLSDNYIVSLERSPPNKAAALAYLDNNASAPVRSAIATVYAGGRDTPAVLQYLVGPLPVSASTNYSLLATIPYNLRMPDDIEYAAFEELVVAATTDLADLLVASYNTTYDGLTWTDTAPGGRNRSERLTWIWFMRATRGHYIHPVGLAFQIDSRGTDTSLFSIVQVVYNFQAYTSVAALMADFRNNTNFTLISYNKDESVLSASDPTTQGTPRPLEHLPPPVEIQPAGARFVVNGFHVNYLGWSFQIAERPSAALSLWDIRFLGQRIIYEFSLQEAEASYGGFQEYEANSKYIDSAWGMGYSVHELVPGADCPEHAYFQDLVLYSTGPTHILRKKNALCIFEHNQGVPLRRHFDQDANGGYTYVSSLQSTVLVVRTINTVYNYDYVYDYLFHVNGVVESRVYASGYLQGATWSAAYAADINSYGGRLMENTAGAVHDHIVLYKVDLDVAGVGNNLKVAHIEREVRTDIPGFNGRPHIQRRVRREQILTEDVSRFGYDITQPKSFLIESATQTNRWGQSRGYQVMPLSHAVDIVQDNPNSAGLSWARWTVSVSQYHDNEPFASSVFNQAIMSDPWVNFLNFFANNESLANQDLVVWASVGLQHIPRAEDVPVTPSNYFASLIIKPNNYFDADPSYDLLNAVYLSADGSKNVANTAAKINQCVYRRPQFVYNGQNGDQ